ncbi:MAG: DUF438 domain-containing protein [Ignavibacteriales bacterium]|nr:DUF438 domain-containing protein [Ignavibacteriales bacterium]HOJ19015.1 DUF438 domain-containing protein [Ignavibacteriaceae bacterium]
MSEIINNSQKRRDELKKLILDLHNGISVDETKKKLTEMLGSVPYGEVVQAEQELISEGLPEEEILKFCDIHSEALKGKIDLSHAKTTPEGHPVDTFKLENRAVETVLQSVRKIFLKIYGLDKDTPANSVLMELREEFNKLADLEKHYVRKENLLFPYLEKAGITGPPAVMWGKHDEIREYLKSSLQLVRTEEAITVETLTDFVQMMFEPTVTAIHEMIYKEENILFPMCMDTLTEIEWYEIYRQSDSIGYTLAAPAVEWKPEIAPGKEPEPINPERIQLSSGSFSKDQLEAIFASIPLDITFVDHEDKVAYFSHGKERIFERSKAILGRQVQYCHPPSSVHIVEKIINDFKSGAQDSAKFWISYKGMYVHIAYYAVRNEKGEYLGTLELTQDINEYKKVEGERRLLTYDK